MVQGCHHLWLSKIQLEIYSPLSSKLNISKLNMIDRKFFSSGMRDLMFYYRLNNSGWLRLCYIGASKFYIINIQDREQRQVNYPTPPIFIWYRLADFWTWPSSLYQWSKIIEFSDVSFYWVEPNKISIFSITHVFFLNHILLELCLIYFILKVWNKNDGAFLGTVRYGLKFIRMIHISSMLESQLLQLRRRLPQK